MIGGKAKKVFPGNNTCRGFFSFYDNIVKPDATRVFIIKGGPGVGKSTFMERIATAMRDKGYATELHCCSSDNDSLDGVVIPAIKVALIDGTAPHVVDPRNPGAVDEIIHLGEYWDEGALVKNKARIIACNQRVARLFKTAYSYLKEAKVACDEADGYYTEAMNPALLYKSIHLLCSELFYGAPVSYDRPAMVRRLFASANTPDGLVNYIDTILADTKKLYILKGEPAAGRDELMASVLDRGLQMGIDAEVFHCPFEPDKIEMICYDKLQTAVLYQNDRLDFDPGVLQKLESLEILDLDRHLDQAVCDFYKEEIRDAKSRIGANIDRAYRKIKEAKSVHDEMEKYYIPAMDFAAVNKKKEEVLERILGYAQAAAD